MLLLHSVFYVYGFDSELIFYFVLFVYSMASCNIFYIMDNLLSFIVIGFALIVYIKKLLKFSSFKANYND